MSKIIELKGTLEKVVIVNGKTQAQMMVTIPVEFATQVPLGPVSMTMEKINRTIFEGEEKKPVRGVAGENR